MTQNIKKLPVIAPPLTSYQHHAVILSMLNNEDLTKEWVFSHYIQLFSIKNDETYKKKISFFDFYSTSYIMDSTPWLNNQKISKQELDKTDIVDFLIESIDNERYVYIVVECLYISAHKTNTAFPHPIIIFGYNHAEKVFYIADFFGTVFSFKEASFEEIRQSFEGYVEDSFWWNGAKLFERKQHLPDVNIPLEYYKSIFLDYINSTHQAEYSLNYGNDEDHFIKVTEGTNVGISVYDDIIEDIWSNEHAIDFRIMPILTDQKKNISHLIEYLKINKGLSLVQPDQLYKEIYKNMLITRNLNIKNFFSRRITNTMRITDYIKRIRELEYKAIDMLLSEL